MKAHRHYFHTPLAGLVCGVMALFLAGAPAGSAPVPSPGGGVAAGPSGAGPGVPPAGALTPSSGAAPAAVPSPCPGGSATGDSFLEGTACWDIELVREYIKKVQKVDMAATPAPYAGHGDNKDMLSKVNPEFAKRVDALMAIYQAHGGDKSPEVVKDLGIVPKTGGFRSPQEQFEVWKKCRRIKKTADGKPVGDGSKEEHWEVIPPAERVVKRDGVGPKSAEYEHRIVQLQEFDSIVVRIPRDRPAEPNCEYSDRIAWDHRTQTWVEVMGPVTHAWVSWHNLGLAADFSQIISIDKHGKKTKALATPIDQNNVMKKAWKNMLDAASDLGMVWGGWWKGQNNDPAHVEWHPRFLATDSKNQIPSETAPLTLTAEQMGYKWKIPSRIVLFAGNPGGFGPRGGFQRWSVLELVVQDGWISATGQRSLESTLGHLRGEWTSYDPPIKLFPAYIPTITLERNEETWPEDIKWRGKTTVTFKFYDEIVATNGKVIKATHNESTGVAHFAYRLSMDDWQKRASLWKERALPNAGRYDRFIKASVYEIRVSFEPLKESKDRAPMKSRIVDQDGYTSDSSVEDHVRIPVMLPGGSQMAWNRDNGMIGAKVALVNGVKGGQVYDVTNDNTGYVVLDQPPAGDRKKAPAWPPANPRPSPRTGGTCSRGWGCR